MAKTMNEKPINLYQPIKFKRWECSKWETGWKMINDNGESFLEKDKKTTVEQIHEYKVDWGIGL